MDSKIQFNPSIERRQKDNMPEEKQGKNIWKEAIYNWPSKAISRSSENNLGRARMEKAKFF